MNKKLLQQHLSESSGKVVTLKDISNISTEVHKLSSQSLEDVVTKLKEIKGKVLNYYLLIVCYTGSTVEV